MYIVFSSAIVELGETAPEARCVILEIANALKIVIFPSMIKLFFDQFFETASIFFIWFSKLFWFYRFSLLTTMFFVRSISVIPWRILLSLHHYRLFEFFHYLDWFQRKREVTTWWVKRSIIDFLFLKKRRL